MIGNSTIKQTGTVSAHVCPQKSENITLASKEVYKCQGVFFVLEYKARVILLANYPCIGRKHLS